MEFADFFAKRLAQLRMEKGVSARDMSLSLGQSESYINKIENKRTMPSMQGFAYICEYLGVTPRDFFDTEMPSPTTVQNILKELRKLSFEKAEHILQIIRDINDK